MPDVTASYGKPLNFITFFFAHFEHYSRIFMSEVPYLQQTFTDCVFN